MAETELVDNSIHVEPSDISQDILLYQTKHEGIKLIIPNPPRIPIEEGLTIQITHENDAADTERQILHRYLFALAGAKVLAESDMSPDAWANTRLEKGNVVSVYGRNPAHPDAWRKPVETHNRNATAITATMQQQLDLPRLQKLMSKYIPDWEKLASTIELFTRPENVRNAVTTVIPEKNADVTVWESDTFIVNMILHPHLEGFHLCVSPKEKYERQWQTELNRESIQPYILRTLEATAVARGVQLILAKGEGELHNSGNWATHLMSRDDAYKAEENMKRGRMDMDALTSDDSSRRKREKRMHRPDIADKLDQINTSMHVHAYLPDGEETGRVTLPPMSSTEAKERKDLAMAKGESTDYYDRILRQWESIPSTSRETAQSVAKQLNEKLGTWLQEHVAGKLLPANDQSTVS